ncbi:MAG: hypothetical protein ABGZ35_20425, partial [Planctomycetaceae bacterium]
MVYSVFLWAICVWLWPLAVCLQFGTACHELGCHLWRGIHGILRLAVWFSHHLSLDDAVFKNFVREGVRDILEKLGMKADEAIESRIVSRRIRAAQEKIEGRTFGSLEA